jgi:hypothetical protein
MKLQTLSGIDKSIGGRPKAQSQKRRHAFYLSESESELLKSYSLENDIAVSELVRHLVKQILKA